MDSKDVGKTVTTDGSLILSKIEKKRKEPSESRLSDLNDRMTQLHREMQKLFRNDKEDIRWED